jgi:hypothetical protein
VGGAQHPLSPGLAGKRHAGILGFLHETAARLGCEEWEHYLHRLRRKEMTMDVPILAVIIGVSGTLLGTVAGGTIAIYGNVYLARRRE